MFKSSKKAQLVWMPVLLAILFYGGSGLTQDGTGYDLPEGLWVEELPEETWEQPPRTFLLKGELVLKEGFGRCTLWNHRDVWKYKKETEGIPLIWRSLRQDYLGHGRCRLETEPDDVRFSHVSVMVIAHPKYYMEESQLRIKLMLEFSSVTALDQSGSDVSFPNLLGPVFPRKILDLPAEVPEEIEASDSTVVEP